MDNGVGRVLGARSQIEYRDDLTDRIDRDPQPERVRLAPQPRADLVQLNVQQVQVLSDAVVQGRAVLPSTGEPGGDGSMLVAEDPHRGRDIQSFGQRREDLTHALGWGFEAIERSHPEGTRGAC